MEVLQLAVAPNNPQSGCAIFKKGLELNGYKVDTFDYREVAGQCGIVTMNEIVKQKALAKPYDFIWIGKGEQIAPETLSFIKKYTKSKIVLWHGDQRKNPEEFIERLLQYTDYFLHTTAGTRLLHYHDVGKQSLSIFFFNPCDPSFFTPAPTSDSWKTDVVFTGTSYSIAEPEREHVISYLKTRADCKLYGAVLPRVRRHDYLNAIRGSKIGVHINGFNNFQLYNSDRLTHYLSLETMVLAYKIPGIESMFTNKKHLVLYTSIEELKTLIDYYLNNEEERKAIALAGKELAHKEYNTQNIVKSILSVINGGSPRFTWMEYYKR